MTIERGQPMLATDILNLTFFPKGAILIFSSAAWGATSAEFKTIWKICNAANHATDQTIPDLTNKFLRGADSSGAEGGADSRDVTLQTDNLPSHNHEATGLSLDGLSTSGLSVDYGGAHGHSGSGVTTSDSGGHTHSVSGTTSDISGDNYGEYSIKSNRGAIRNESTYSGRISRGTTYDGGPETASSPTGYSLRIDFAHTHTYSCDTAANGGAHSHNNINVTIPEGGSHSHTISGSITGGNIKGSTAHTGTGAVFSIDTVPKYYQVIYIMKVA
ncbi:MAG: hypothetical protein LBL50_05010 [Candidatus Margulisbacteria bacterium]|jgi:hypothetical protein|nr:hypothetical protein [Candidatus Margulisiibacteriota bacterium]